jgi:hypothetical protein
MRSLPAWTLLLAPLACAPASRPPATGAATGAPTTAPTTAPATMRVSTPGGTLNIRVRPDEMRSTFIVAAAPDRVWGALPAAFDSLGVPAGVVDVAARRYGTTGLRVRRRLGTTPVSRYFDCGQTQIGENADEYDVQLQVVATVTAGTAGTTNVEVLLDARARPVAFSQGYQSCSTRGTLDKRLVELVRAELTRP